MNLPLLTQVSSNLSLSSNLVYERVVSQSETKLKLKLDLKGQTKSFLSLKYRIKPYMG